MNGTSVECQGQSISEELGRETALLEGIQSGDVQAIAAFIKKYRDLVIAITDDVLGDGERSTCAAKAAFRQAVQQIRRGVKPGQVEPWLMWLVRSEALSMTQCRKNAQTAETRPDAWETGPAALPLRADAGQDGASKDNVAPLQKEKLSACEGETEGLRTARQTDGQTGSCDSVRSFEKTTAENAADPETSPTADLREEAPPKGAADAAAVSGLQQKSRGGKSYNIGMTLVLSALIVLLVWVVLGLGMSRGLFHLPDLGYAWVNAHLFPLF